MYISMNICIYRYIDIHVHILNMMLILAFRPTALCAFRFLSWDLGVAPVLHGSVAHRWLSPASMRFKKYYRMATGVGVTASGHGISPTFECIVLFCFVGNCIYDTCEHRRHNQNMQCMQWYLVMYMYTCKRMSVCMCIYACSHWGLQYFTTHSDHASYHRDSG